MVARPALVGQRRIPSRRRDGRTKFHCSVAGLSRASGVTSGSRCFQPKGFSMNEISTKPSITRAGKTVATVYRRDPHLVRWHAAHQAADDHDAMAHLEPGHCGEVLRGAGGLHDRRGATADRPILRVGRRAEQRGHGSRPVRHPDRGDAPRRPRRRVRSEAHVYSGDGDLCRFSLSLLPSLRASFGSPYASLE